MILVTASVSARPDTLDELLRLSVEHVHRSRSEPGCVAHGVHQDVDDRHRLVFLETWADRDALLAHFAVPAARHFAEAVVALAAEPPSMEIYEAARAVL